MGSDLVVVRRALVSVSDKTGLEGFARGLVEEFGVELISTGGTAKFLRAAGLKVTDVSEVTGFPEMMDGRVKTLHPKIHGGLLALRDHAEHVAAAKEHGIGFIDLVCINLYPFAQTIAKPGVSFEEAIENIDIGGPSMVRSAAKNHGFVAVVTDAGQYEKVLGDLREHKGATCGRHRLKLAVKAFELTATYDRMIADYLREATERRSDGATKGQTGGGTGRFMSGPAGGGIGLAMEEEPMPPGKGRPGSRARLFKRLMKSTGNLSQFLHDLLMAQAVGAGGTEAACFLVGGQGLTLVDHIRPDRSPAEIRAQAVAAFKEIVQPCLAEGKDGAIEIGAAEPDRNGVQFCLVTLLRDEDEVVAVTAVITRSWDKEKATERLQAMQVLAGYFDLFQAGGSLSPEDRVELAAYLSERLETELPEQLSLGLTKKQALRYGENPHQKGALYVEQKTQTGMSVPLEASVVGALQHHGKELSYINLLDADAAMGAVKEFADRAAACVVKHATPCGLGVGDSIAEAFGKAYAGDPVAAFGGIVALNRVVDEETARQMVEGQKFLEVVVSPGYTEGALELLKGRWKNVRLLEARGEWKAASGEMMMHKIAGGYLVQERDEVGIVESEWKVVSERNPTEGEMEDMRVAWLACKHVKSNAIVIAKNGMMLGAGAGQQDRVNACRIAVAKARERARGAVAASDAFFPFADGPGVLMDAGVVGLVQPGGSVRDGETIELVNQRGGVMVVTGRRHFKH